MIRRCLDYLGLHPRAFQEVNHSWLDDADGEDWVDPHPHRPTVAAVVLTVLVALCFAVNVTRGLWA